MLHYSVLLHESVELLDIKPDGLYIDGTFGRGGHSGEILKRLNDAGKLIAFDRDPDAIMFGRDKFERDSRLILVHRPFSEMYDYCKAVDLVGKIDGILLDLGVSSPQLDVAERGFSFMHDGPLDMRMDPTHGQPVSEVIKMLSREELSDIFKMYGEERYAWSIAGAIKAALERGELIERTSQLANVIENQVSRKEKKHPATRCFQALRIYVNDELGELDRTLEGIEDLLKVGGRASIISFHSLEDRRVKTFFEAEINGKASAVPRGLPMLAEQQSKFKWVKKKIKASNDELGENIRSRSAVLRGVERL